MSKEAVPGGHVDSAKCNAKVDDALVEGSMDRADFYVRCSFTRLLLGTGCGKRGEGWVRQGNENADFYNC